jgi:2-oxoglutarate/2-oxoacid ferredoxin oxidoreductase subunit alpha
VFGTTKMPVREAMKWLEREGVSVNLMQVVTVWPFPAEEVSEFLGKAKRTAIIEGNFTGQLQGLVREHCLSTSSTRSTATTGGRSHPSKSAAFIKEVLA